MESFFATPGLILIALVLGVLGGLVAGLTPGVSGRVGLLLVTPLAIGFGPLAGAVFLVAFHSVVHTSGSVPAILLGVPTSAAEAATVIDGHVMTRKGEGAQAIGATIAASAVGGVVGALVLMVLAPVALGTARIVGAPEIALLSLLGLLSISALSGGRMAGGLMVACLGLLVASVGVEPFTGASRYVFGLNQLWDGVTPASVVTGLFVAPELLSRQAGNQTDGFVRPGLRAVLSGFVEALTRRWLLLRTSILGAIVGMAPGLGASVAVWIAYAHARQTEPSEVPYGEGALAGVIAPEAANNAKEGGALAPALFFGIPSSSGMGILLAAFVMLGVEVGPRMLITQPDFVYLMAGTNIAANLLAAPICLALAPLMARLSSVRSDVIAPVALAAAVAATQLSDPSVTTLVMVGVFSLVGLLLKAADLPRAPLLLALVLAPGLESGVLRSITLHEWSVFMRPGVWAILLTVAGLLLVAASRRKAGSESPDSKSPLSAGLPLATGVAAAIFVGALIFLGPIATEARVLPMFAAFTGLAAAGLTGLRLFRCDRNGWAKAVSYDPVVLALFGGMLIGAVVNTASAASAFAFIALAFRARVRYSMAALASLGLGGVTLALELLGQ